MIQRNYKPDEWQYLNALAATIYIRVGTAMTWTRRADLAFDSFQKDLPYATASGDKELITLARKRVDEWKNVARSDDNGCLNWPGWIIIIVIIFLLAR